VLEQSKSAEAAKEVVARTMNKRHREELRAIKFKNKNAFNKVL
jgi:hypothetical protein